MLYDAVALPIITYGAAGWTDKVDHSMVKRSLMVIQRALLLLLTRACRMTATASIQVVAGRLPLDLEIIKKGLTRKIKRELSVSWKQYNYDEDLNEEVDLKSELEFLEREITTEWQRRWETESRGRERYKYRERTIR